MGSIPSASATCVNACGLSPSPGGKVAIIKRLSSACAPECALDGGRCAFAQAGEQEALDIKREPGGRMAIISLTTLG